MDNLFTIFIIGMCCGMVWDLFFDIFDIFFKFKGRVKNRTNDYRN